MVQSHKEDPGSGAEPLGSASADESGWAARRNGWINGIPPLPETLLWAAVGDLDVIERLSRQAHQVRFPTWLCSYDGHAWPCEPARGDLLLDLGWIKLSIYCAVMMERATKDLPSSTPKELWQRFIEWTEPPEEARNFLLKPTA